MYLLSQIASGFVDDILRGDVRDSEESGETAGVGDFCHAWIALDYPLHVSTFGIYNRREEGSFEANVPEGTTSCLSLMHKFGSFWNLSFFSFWTGCGNIGRGKDIHQLYLISCLF